MNEDMNQARPGTIGLPHGAVSKIALQLEVDPLLVSRIARALMSSMNQTATLNNVLPRGTLNKIALQLHVHRSLVSRVARGLNTSARVSAAIEAERRMMVDKGRRSNAQTVTQA